MNKELKIVSINNVTFKKPLGVDEAFKKYETIMQEKVIEDLTNTIKEHSHLDLVENTAPIGSMKLLTKEE